MLLWASVFFFLFVIYFSSRVLILSIHAQIHLFRLFVKKKIEKARREWAAAAAAWWDLSDRLYSCERQKPSIVMADYTKSRLFRRSSQFHCACFAYCMASLPYDFHRTVPVCTQRKDRWTEMGEKTKKPPVLTAHSFVVPLGETLMHWTPPSFEMVRLATLISDCSWSSIKHFTSI